MREQREKQVTQHALPTSEYANMLSVLQAPRHSLMFATP